MACESSRIGIGGVLAQPVTDFSEKVNETKQRYSSYDKEFYAIIQTLCYWRYQLIPQEFVLFSDHEALKCIYSQKKWNAQHERWIESLQDYTKAGVENKTADALNRHIFVLTKMSTVVTGFMKLKTEYKSSTDFRDIYIKLKDGTTHELGGFILQDGYLFQGQK